MNKKVLERAINILDIAKRMAANRRLSCNKDETYSFAEENQIENIQLHTSGYVEPGYSSKTDIVATGNWNDITIFQNFKQTTSNLPSRINWLFVKLGIECEWNDEWGACDDCSKLFRIHPDHHSWKPSFVCNVKEGYTRCKECEGEK